MKHSLLRPLVAIFVSISLLGIALADKPAPPTDDRKPAKRQRQQLRERQAVGPVRPADAEGLGAVAQLLHDLQEQVRQLRDEIRLLRKELGQQKQSRQEARLGRVHLDGGWRMTLPAGFQHEVTLAAQGDHLYRLDFPGNSAGVYRHEGSRLSMEIPRDERLTEFVWQLQNENLLLLIESPPTAKTGAEYRGAVLHRMSDKVATPEGQPRRER